MSAATCRMSEPPLNGKAFGGRQLPPCVKDANQTEMGSAPGPLHPISSKRTRAICASTSHSDKLCVNGSLSFRALREVWWKHGGVPSSRRPRSCRRSQRKGGATRLVMERAQPRGYHGGSYTNPWSPIDHARHHSAHYCARN